MEKIAFRRSGLGDLELFSPQMTPRHACSSIDLIQSSLTSCPVPEENSFGNVLCNDFGIVKFYGVVGKSVT